MPQDKKGKEPGTSLDAFFEPSEEEIPKDKEHKYYPVDKDKIDLLKDEPEAEAAPAEEPKAKKGKAGKKVKEKKAQGAGESKTLLIILVVVLGILALAAAGYFGGTFLYKKFLKKGEEIALTITKPKPKPPQPAGETAPTPPTVTKPGEAAPVTTPTKPTGEKPAPLTSPKPAGPTPPIKVTPGKPPAPTAPAPVQPAPTKPATTPAKPPAPKTTPTAPAKPAPTQPTPKPAIAPTKPQPVALTSALPASAPGKGWSCQVGAYLLNESMEGPVSALKNLGYQNLYYVDTTRSLTIYHLYLKGAFDQKTAEQKKRSLEQIGFKPRLEAQGNQSRVIAYSYGSNSVAQGSKAKIEKAGLGPSEIVSKTGPVVLHQVRVGTYSSLSDARQILGKLQANNFKPVLVQER